MRPESQPASSPGHAPPHPLARDDAAVDAQHALRLIAGEQQAPQARPLRIIARRGFRRGDAHGGIGICELSRQCGEFRVIAVRVGIRRNGGAAEAQQQCDERSFDGVHGFFGFCGFSAFGFSPFFGVSAGVGARRSASAV